MSNRGTKESAMWIEYTYRMVWILTRHMIDSENRPIVSDSYIAPKLKEHYHFVYCAKYDKYRWLDGKECMNESKEGHDPGIGNHVCSKHDDRNWVR